MTIKLRNILFPTDFSEFSEHALRYTASFAQEYNAKVFLLHVIEDLADVSNYLVLYYPPDEALAEIKKIAQSKLEKMKNWLASLSVDAENIVVTGTPFMEIVKAVKELDIDLIVMTTHGLGGLDYAIMGSTTEKVVRKAPCPVMSIRPTDVK